MEQQVRQKSFRIDENEDQPQTEREDEQPEHP